MQASYRLKIIELFKDIKLELNGEIDYVRGFGKPIA